MADAEAPMTKTVVRLRRKRARRGAAALFEFGIAAVALLVLLSGFVGWKNLNDGRRDAIHLADQTESISDAVGRYVSDNYQAFVSCLVLAPGKNVYKYYQMTDSVPAEGAPTCQASTVGGNAVNATFANAALLQQQGTANEYGQTYMVALRAYQAPGANADQIYLEGFVYTVDGDPVPDDILSMVARRSGTVVAFAPTFAALVTGFTNPAWMTSGTGGTVAPGHLAATLNYTINTNALGGQIHQFGLPAAATNPASLPQDLQNRRTSTMQSSLYMAYRPPTAAVNGGNTATPLPANICFPYLNAAKQPAGYPPQCAN